MAIDGLSLANINKFKDKESTEILSGAAKVAKEEAELTVEKVKESSEKEQEKQQSRKHELIKQEEEQLLEDQAEKQKKKKAKSLKSFITKNEMK